MPSNIKIKYLLRDSESRVKSLISHLKTNEVTSLSFSNNQLSNEDIFILCEALKDPETSVKALDLSYNPMNEETASYISDMLEQNVTLTHINLSHNGIETNVFLSRLTTALMGNSNLKFLDISYNKFDENSFSTILSGIKNCTHKNLSDFSLNVEDNPTICPNWNTSLQEALLENELNFLSHENKELRNTNQLLKSRQYPILFSFSLNKILPAVAAVGLFLGVSACNAYTRCSK